MDDVGDIEESMPDFPMLTETNKRWQSLERVVQRREEASSSSR
jgi:hypothetical protein